MAHKVEQKWERPERDQVIRHQVVRDLYDRSRPAIVVMLVMLGVIRWAIDPVYRLDPRIHGVFSLLIAITLARFVLAMVPRARRETLLGVRAQFIALTSGIALSSLSLGALVVLTWPLLDPARIAIFAVVTSGLVSGAVMSLGFSPPVYLTYMLPPVGALFVMAVTDTRPPWGANILATSFVIYAAAVVAISLDQRRTRHRAIELEMQLSDAVIRDTLTSLHNRRFLQEFMVVESARIHRDAVDLEHGRQPIHDAATGLFMLDLDWFKQVNDRYGHRSGDAVLAQAAAALDAALRKSDHLVRWGGEEFVAIARVKHLHHVCIVAEKLRSAIESTDFLLPDGTVLKKTVSLGFAAMPFLPGQPRKLTWEQVLSVADAALYLAKDEGRNRWVGALAGEANWPDSDAACASVVHDLRAAAESGLVKIQRA